MDLVMASAFNLNWSQVRVWAKSLIESKFDGDIIVVYFGDNPELFKKLYEMNIKVAVFPDLPSAMNVCVTRFAAYHSILSDSQTEYDWVLTTDITDVVFQKNPSDYFEDCFFSNINHIASSENLIYNKEQWGKNNLSMSFGPDQYNLLQNNTIYNAGVIAGTHKRISDISNLIHQMCFGRPQHIYGGGGPDQAAYNLILSMQTMNNATRYLNHDRGWACQCGTTMDPNRQDYWQDGISPLPKFDGTHVTTSNGEPYYIVHQYNRVPELREHFERKYNV